MSIAVSLREERATIVAMMRTTSFYLQFNEASRSFIFAGVERPKPRLVLPREEEIL